MFTPREIAYLRERFRLVLMQRLKTGHLAEGVVLYDALLKIIEERRRERLTDEELLLQFIAELAAHLLENCSDQDFTETTITLLRKKLQK